MKKVSFFQSVHVKTVLIYMLLILIAMQIIGVYFVRQLETTLKENFTTSIQDKVKILGFYLEEQLTDDKIPEDDSSSIKESVRKLLVDYRRATDIEEIRVIDGKSYKIIGTSKADNQVIVGQKTTDTRIRRAIATAQADDQELIDRETGDRIWAYVFPVISDDKDDKEVIAAVYVVANIENVFGQMEEINKIFSTGTAIALAITAILGIFLARAITRPITDMRRQALALAKGNFSRKVKIYGQDEIGQLAATFNTLTKKLQEAQATTESERRKLSSVLTSMTDGVIATDQKGPGHFD